MKICAFYVVNGIQKVKDGVNWSLLKMMMIVQFVLIKESK
jgi:hypothetical protein